MKTYKLFASCVKVKGFNRSIICDLQRHLYYLIPNSLFNLFDSEDLLKINRLNFSQEENLIIEEYLSFLLEKELVFLIDDDELNLFPQLSQDWNYPSLITNIIVDIKDWELNWPELINQLEEIKCYNIQIRFFKTVNSDVLKKVLTLVYRSLICAIEVLAPYSKELNMEDLIAFSKENPKLKSLIFYAAKESKEISPPSDRGAGIFFICDEIPSHKLCGVIDPSYFSINIETFTESQAHNSCLNRKISIDMFGYIKNCPSMDQSYGHIKNTKLKDVLEKPEFRKYWTIHKDEVLTCKDCEFRHICTDCRAYVENPEDIYSKPLKCGYNPYNNQWEEWSLHPLKQEGIIYYNLKEIV